MRSKFIYFMFVLVIVLVFSSVAIGQDIIPTPNEEKWGKIPDQINPSKDAKYTLITATMHPAPHPEDIAFKYFHKRVEELTNGVVTTSYFPGGVLFPGGDRDVLTQVRKGDVSVSRVDASSMTSISPTSEIGAAIFLFDSPKHIYRFTERKEFKQIVDNDLLDKGIVNFGVVAFARHLYTRLPVKSLDDLKGLKIRTMEVPSVMDAWNALGANATPLPWGELFTSLQTRLVDGAEGSATAFYSARFYEIVKNFTAVYYKYSTIYFVANKDTLNALPEDLRKLVIQAGRETVQLTREIYEDWESDVFKFISKQGIKVYLQQDITDYNNWRDIIDKANINKDIFEKVGSEFKEIIEETR